MAGDWIKMRDNLWDDPRIAAVCDQTDASEATVIGGLYWLWATADQHSEDGFMPGLTVRSINRKTVISGFGEALVSIGWVESVEDGIQIVRFEEHNGTSAKKRVVTAKRVANHRQNTEVTQPALQKSDAGVTGALAREREREEDRKPKTTTVAGKVDSLPADNEPGGGGGGSLECPVTKIVDAYHASLPNNPRVEVLDARRSATITDRWHQAAGLQCKPFGYDTVESGLSAWTAFFAKCAATPFLIGKERPDPGRPIFKADIDFLMREDAFVKCLEGAYRRDVAPVSKAGAPGWWRSNESALVQANAVGTGPAYHGESKETWHARIRAAIANGETPAAPPLPATAIEPTAPRPTLDPALVASRMAALRAALLTPEDRAQ